jgi:recombination protein RecT
MTTVAKPEDKKIATKPIDRLKLALSAESVRAQFQNALADKANLFMANIVELYGGDANLQECDPNRVIMECLKAATLDLPLNKSLGFAYIVAYKGVPQFQIGYKGIIQLAMRTGQYRDLNAGIVYEGVKVERDMLSGRVSFSGDPASDKPQGYFAFFRLLNGFEKPLYMTVAEVDAHAKRFSKSYGFPNSTWKTNFDAMAIKTCLRLLLSKYGPMSVSLEELDDEENAQAAIDQGMAAGQLLEPGKTEAPKTDPEPQPQTETKQEPAKKAPFLQ